MKGLTILVNFQDLTSTVTRADVDEMLNGPDFTRNGNICSAREYFRRVSSGKLDYSNVVVGPYKLSRNREFYVNNLLVEEALQLALADGLDLKQFNSQNHNIVDALNVLYAGRTQYRGDLWPHNSSIDLTFGTMHTDLYLLTSLGRSAGDLSIGTFCHENGHLLCRFPDMYDYGERDGDTTASAGIGSYCLMGSGNHLDNGRSPSPVCAYLRDLAGWCDNETDLGVSGTYQAAHGDYNRVMKYRTSKGNEYFLLENRSKMDLDRGGSSSELAVYHCDFLGSNELQQGTAAKHYQCALLQADGRGDLESGANQGDGSDLYGAVSGVALSSSSRPHTREWDGRASRAGDLGYCGPRSVDLIPGRRGGFGAEANRPSDAQHRPARQPGRGRLQRHRYQRLRNGGRDFSEGRNRTSVHWRSPRHPPVTGWACRCPSCAARRVDRQSNRDLHFGNTGGSSNNGWPALSRQLGAERFRSRRPRRRSAQVVEHRTRNRRLPGLLLRFTSPPLRLGRRR